MASAGTTARLERVSFIPTTTYNQVGQVTLESDGTSLYFNGGVIGTSGNQFQYITTGNITPLVDSSNIVVSSNLVLVEQPVAPNPSSSGTEGFQYYAGLVYYNGVSLASTGSVYDNLQVDVLYPRANTEILVEGGNTFRVGDSINISSANVMINSNLDINAGKAINHFNGGLHIGGNNGVDLTSNELHSNIQLQGNSGGNYLFASANAIFGALTGNQMTEAMSKPMLVVMLESWDFVCKNFKVAL